MVFGALLEFALVNYISHFNVVAKKKRLLAFEDMDDFGNSEDAKAKEKLRKDAVDIAEARLVAQALSKAKKVDLVSRVLFPLVFCIFNFAYWGHYLQLYFGFLEEFKAELDKLSS